MALLLYRDINGRLVERPNPTAEDMRDCIAAYANNKEALAEAKADAIKYFRQNNVFLRYLCRA